MQKEGGGWGGWGGQTSVPTGPVGFLSGLACWIFKGSIFFNSFSPVTLNQAKLEVCHDSVFTIEENLPTRT